MTTDRATGPHPRWRTASIAVAAACLFFLALGPARVVAQDAAQRDGLDVDRLAAATVLISPDPADPAQAGWGSGSVISEDGLILTNAHVAADWAPGIAVHYPLYHYLQTEPSTLYVYTVASARERARPAYQAEVMAVDGYLDLAVLRVTADAGGKPVDPADLRLTPVEVGTANDLRPLDVLTVAGFPDLAETFAVRFSRGEVHNFSDDPLVGLDAWIHTDAKIASGNSGGLAVDASGRLVAVPTQVSADGPEGAVDFNMRPVDLARPLIDAARQGSPYDPDTHVVRPSGNEAAMVMGWADEWSAECDATGRTIAFGTSTAYAHIQFAGMVPGDHVLVELARLDAPDASLPLVAYHRFDWDRDGPDAACEVVPLTFDRDFPWADTGSFYEGEYGAYVSVGPRGEVAVSEPSPADAVRVERPFVTAFAGGTDSTGPATGDLLGRAARSVTRCSAVEDRDQQEPLAYGATAAVRCKAPSPGISQLTLFQFPDAISMARYWRDHQGDLPQTVRAGAKACRNGRRGISTWADGTRHGIVACDMTRSARGTRTMQVRWTDESSLVLGVIDSDSTNLRPLFRWWRQNAR